MTDLEEATAPKAPPLTRRTPRVLAVCVIATIALTAFDLWTKDLALENLSAEPAVEPLPACERDENGYASFQRRPTEPITIIEGNFELRYAENCGAAFSMLADAPSVVRHGVFGIAAVIATVVLFWMLFVGKGGGLFAWAVPLIVSGALGNLIDRFRFGYVVDFFHAFWSYDLPLLGRSWPIFNVADITILVGLGLMLLDGYYVEKALAEQTKALEQEAPAS